MKKEKLIKEITKHILKNLEGDCGLISQAILLMEELNQEVLDEVRKELKKRWLK